jgi:hypothetical protein
MPPCDGACEHSVERHDAPKTSYIPRNEQGVNQVEARFIGHDAQSRAQSSECERLTEPHI